MGSILSYNQGHASETRRHSRSSYHSVQKPSKDIFSEVRNMNVAKGHNLYMLMVKLMIMIFVKYLVISIRLMVKLIKGCRIQIIVSYYMIMHDDVNAVKYLKLGMSDGEEGLHSDHLVILCHILNAMNFSGMCLNSMFIGAMILIPKVKQ